MKLIHYAVERGPDGMPARLVWSQEIQAAGEAAAIKHQQEQRQHSKPMQDYAEWAKARGLFE